MKAQNSESHTVESTPAIASTSTSDTPEPTDNPSSKPNVGAIVGGVIGVVVVIGLFVIVIVWLRRRKKLVVPTDQQEPYATTPQTQVYYEAPADSVFPKSAVSH
ncbi:hypothetical protein FVEN_g12869 [Fusarium venenatum]|nr:hypothetical protein FVEN_g12869 [Fusarium venenatum]